jgi:3-deoxy-7-phosphoheptulonate synthase
VIDRSELRMIAPWHFMNPKWNGQFSRFDLVASTPDGVRSIVRAGGVEIGGNDFVVMAGPCAVESERQLLRTAEAVAAAGARILRGGAYKPRSSPYAFQGLGLEGLKILRKAREETGLAIVTEAMSDEDVDLVAEYADLMQVGTRSMENYSLLEKLGGCGRPVLLKRGMTATLEELLQSAQIIAMNGNSQIVLCERGIRTFETATRNTLDIAAVPVLKAVSHLPVIVDPSHAAGVRCLVPVLARAAAVVGADGILVEVHPSPDEALSDGAQSLTFRDFRDMMDDLQPYLAIRDAQTAPQLVATGAAD